MALSTRWQFSRVYFQPSKMAAPMGSSLWPGNTRAFRFCCEQSALTDKVR